MLQQPTRSYAVAHCQHCSLINAEYLNPLYIAYIVRRLSIVQCCSESIKCWALFLIFHFSLTYRSYEARPFYFLTHYTYIVPGLWFYYLISSKKKCHTNYNKLLGTLQNLYVADYNRKLQKVVWNVMGLQEYKKKKKFMTHY
jgi:hypothetical protein